MHSWCGGVIPDVAEAVDSPVRITSDESDGRRLIDLLPQVPAPVWGRDELATGEMWNSNSVVSWALARAGLPVTGVRPPESGTAPGWDAGIAMAGRQLGRVAQNTPVPGQDGNPSP